MDMDSGGDCPRQVLTEEEEERLDELRKEKSEINERLRELDRDDNEEEMRLMQKLGDLEAALHDLGLPLWPYLSQKDI